MTDWERHAFNRLIRQYKARQERDVKTGEFVSSGFSGETVPAFEPKDLSAGSGVTSSGAPVTDVRLVPGSSVNAGKMFFATIDGEERFLKFSSAQDRAREESARIINNAMNGLVNMPGAEQVKFDSLGDTAKSDIGENAARFDGKEALVVEIVSGETIGEGGRNVENTFVREDISSGDLRDMCTWDALAGNVDRHPGQAMFTDDGKFTSVDHGLAFNSSEYRGTGGNYFQFEALELRGETYDITPRAIDGIQSLLDQRETVTQSLADAGLKPDAIDSLFKRAEVLLDEKELPANLQEFIKSDGKEGFRTAFHDHLVRLAFRL